MESDHLSAEQKLVAKTVQINAPASQIWRMLTTPQLMVQWMAPDIDLHIITNWKVGTPIVMRGHMNRKPFENRGTVLQFEPEKILQYTHLSSLSRLPDQPESYAILDFRLKPAGNQTILTLTATNSATKSIYKHLAFYWNGALELLKRLVEEPAA